MFCGLRLSVETGAHPAVIFFPHLLQLLPVPIPSACYTEVQNIIFPFAVRDQFLVSELQVDAGKTIVIWLKNYQSFINNFLRDVTFERYKIQAS
jgi:hypothetical protein